MTFTIKNHMISTQIHGNEIILSITRVSTAGGKPKTIIRVVDGQIGYRELETSVIKLSKLDDEMFNMIVEHCKAKEEI